jgi:predicted metal-binding protein
MSNTQYTYVHVRTSAGYQAKSFLQGKHIQYERTVALFKWEERVPVLRNSLVCKVKTSVF